MRLWHKDLIEVLPYKQLASQHRECCALRGNGWGRKHRTVDYVFTHNPGKLFDYHMLILKEYIARGSSPNLIWCKAKYRGKNSSAWDIKLVGGSYDEHNNDYLIECCENLVAKLKAKLYKHIDLYSLDDKRTIQVSQELDKIIIVLIKSRYE